MWKPTLGKLGHLEQHRRPSTGPGLAALVGYFGYIFWEYTISKRNLKRKDEIHDEFMRRAKLVYDGNEEILKLMSGAGANEASRRQG